MRNFHKQKDYVHEDGPHHGFYDQGRPPFPRQTTQRRQWGLDLGWWPSLWFNETETISLDEYFCCFGGMRWSPILHKHKITSLIPDSIGNKISSQLHFELILMPHRIKHMDVLFTVDAALESIIKSEQCFFLPRKVGSG